MMNKKKIHYRLIPREYDKVPEGTEALAQRIAAQRQRLVLQRLEKLEARNAASNSEQLSLLKLAEAGVQVAPAYIADLTKRKPVLTLLFATGTILTCSWIVKRVGLKRIIHGANAVAPVLFEYLKANKRQ